MKRQLIEKFVSIEKEIADEHGNIILFGLFQREDSPGWDVVISSDWIGDDTKKPLQYIADKIKSELTPDELLELSAIIPLKPSNGFVRAVTDEFHTEHQVVITGEDEFNGVSVRKSYIIKVDFKKIFEG